MRVWLLYSLGLFACASSGGAGREPTLEYEIAYDDNRPGEASALISSTFEQMVRFKPAAASFHLLRFRAQLAQEGRVRWTVYGQDPLEQPSKELASWERDYPHQMASGPTDGRWVVEDLVARIPGGQSGAIWVGFRRLAGDPRLWSSAIDCENAFVRDSDPAKFLRPMPIRKTPMIRLDWGP
ncbi:MAG TPA: hypothetical protein VKN99_08790 [Polyangia bacterium]|nr:hypothetical protein [Polyangia bacterium]